MYDRVLRDAHPKTRHRTDAQTHRSGEGDHGRRAAWYGDASQLAAERSNECLSVRRKRRRRQAIRAAVRARPELPLGARYCVGDQKLTPLAHEVAVSVVFAELSRAVMADLVASAWGSIYHADFGAVRPVIPIRIGREVIAGHLATWDEHRRATRDRYLPDFVVSALVAGVVQRSAIRGILWPFVPRWTLGELARPSSPDWDSEEIAKELEGDRLAVRGDVK